MSKTIWFAQNPNTLVYFESKLGPTNLIIRCCNCGKQFKGNRSFQDEMRTARNAAEAHGKRH